MVVNKSKASRRRRAVFYLILVIVPIVAAFTIGELLVMVFRPVPYMYPRYKYSPDYGFVLYENTRMVHGWPRKFKYHYTVNELGYWGKAIDPANAGNKSNIVVLGDSYTFGIGVNDGEPYAAVLQAEIGNAYNVINLGTPGWGLTQQIRRYFEFGTLYDPEVVVLQYCSNDPEDNLNNMVTTIESGEFKFSNTSAGIHRWKKLLSRSIIQKSQMYNLYRGRFYEFFQNRYVNKRSEELQQEAATGVRAANGPMPRELFYCELLELFAWSLQEQGVRLIVIAVEGNLEQFEHVAKCVGSLGDAGVFEYVEIEDWVRGVENRYSAEGHWGAGSHRAVGEGLARYIAAAHGP
jgi:hypothetical protein